MAVTLQFSFKTLFFTDVCVLSLIKLYEFLTAGRLSKGLDMFSWHEHCYFQTEAGFNWMVEKIVYCNK